MGDGGRRFIFGTNNHYTMPKPEHENNNRPLTDSSLETLNHLFNAVRAEELREDLIELYHSYLMYTRGNMPSSFERMSRNMYHLIHCLAEVENKN
jgi:hypothetical protein